MLSGGSDPLKCMEHVFAEWAAYRTEEKVFSSATYQESATEGRSRWRRGAKASAPGLWASVVEIQHNPPTMGREPALPGILPAVQVAPCTQIPCQRCKQLCGRLRFHYVSRFTSASAFVPSGHSVAEAWRHYHEHRGEDLVAMAAGGAAVADAWMETASMARSYFGQSMRHRQRRRQPAERSDLPSFGC